MHKFCRSLFLLLTFLITSIAFSEEKILSYNGDIRIDKSGVLLIEENITVNAEGRNIRHGIYRDFPTIYFTDHGLSKVGFQVLDVKRDGQQESYDVKSADNGKRIYIGSKNEYVNSGIHVYTITFRTDRQIKFLSDHDELNFNLIGTGWQFPIEKGYFRIYLPSGNFTKSEVVTGAQGEREYNAQVYTSGSGLAEVFTSSGLRPYQGVTVFLAFPKGIIQEPTESQKYLYYIDDHLGLIILFGSLLFAIFFLVSSLYLFGRDKRTGTVIPKFYPPQNLPVSAVHYISNMSFDTAAFTSLLISACIKGACTITKHKSLFSSSITLTRETSNNKDTDSSKLDLTEQVVLTELFSEGNIVEIGSSYNENLRNASEKLKNILQSNYDEKVFTKNTGLKIVGVLVLIGCIAIVFIREVQLSLYLFPKIELLLVTTLAVTTYLFFKYMNQPLDLGRNLLNEIEGFKMYLGTTEKDIFNKLQPPDETLELFEKYLPFAIALGVENQWSEKFNDKITSALARGEATPFLHSFSNSGFNISNSFSDVSSSLTSSIASSSTPPSSSGSGSGGSSGGGGGGGGGGGW